MREILSYFRSTSMLIVRIYLQADVQAKPGSTTVTNGHYRSWQVNMNCSNRVTLCVLLLSVLTLYGCEDLVIRDTSSLLAPRFQRSEIFGLVAGFGTTFAGVPDLVAMLKRRSSVGMNPTMAGIMGVFQIAWVYYGLLIVSRPVIVWNMIGIVINFVNVGAYLYFVRKARL